MSTETILTNKQGISPALAVWLSREEYDGTDDPNVISATSIIKPIRQFILSERVKDTSVDIMDLVASRMGTAIHNSAEEAWKDPESLKKGLKACGYPDKVISRVKINPTNDEMSNDTIPVFMEQRIEKEFGDITLTGKYDLVLDGLLSDYKTTSVYAYINQSNADKYIEQGSIYRYLSPSIITEDYMQIHHIFTDWSKAASFSNKDYPENKVMTVDYPLMSLQETENFIGNKLNQIKKYRDLPQDSLPECTPEELWQRETKYKYYKDPTKTKRATKNFIDKHEANLHMASKGEGIVIEVKGKAVACNYCKARPICTQAEKLESEDLL